MHTTGDNPEDAATRRRTYRVLDRRIDAPDLPGMVVTATDADELIDLVAADLVQFAAECVREHDVFHLALSGGSTPEPLYERLMYDPDCRRLPWRRTHLWIVDERCVPEDDPRSNFRMIRETIVEHADIPPEHVHPIPATDPQGDRAYEHEFNQAMLGRPRGKDRLDFVLLGMGADGHTASLFPGSDALHETHRLMRAVYHDAVDPPDRITMTYKLINAARYVAVMISGDKKADMVKRIATGNDSFETLPIKGIRPVNGELHWYLDAAACGQAGETES